MREEVALLRTYFPDAEYREEGRWLLLPHYRLPKNHAWATPEVALAVQFPAAYPGQKPYGFHISPPLTVGGVGPQNAQPSTEPPWPGSWVKFSWDLPDWAPADSIHAGSNMVNFVFTIAERLQQWP